MTRKILPLAAAASIGIGAMSACSSSEEKTEYIQTEMLKLDNALDSLKSNRAEGDRAFFDYYEKSKEVIDKAEYKPANAKEKLIKKLFAGIGVMTLGVIAMNRAFPKKDGRGGHFLAFLGGTLSLFAGFIIMLNAMFKEPSLKNVFNNYKETKLTELKVEKDKYLEEK